MGKFYIDFIIDKNVFYTSPGITLVSKTCYQEIIYGPLDGASVSLDQPWPYKGRDPSQAFLFEIVANKSCSIDVDKVWYWKKGPLITCDNSVWLSASRWRNDEYLSKFWLQVKGWKVHLYFVYLILRRYFEYIDLTECGGRLRISMRDKVARNVHQLFDDSASLHM